MKIRIFTALLFPLIMASCASDPDVLGDYFASLGDDATAEEELARYGLAVDTTSLSETETVPTDDEDYIENNKFTKSIYIVYAGDTAYISGNASGATVTAKGADVTISSTVKKMDYHVSGSSPDGCLKIYSDYKFALNLDGVSLANSDGAAINIQSKKRGFIVLTDSTVNTLSDGTAYTDTVAGEDMKAAMFSEGKMLFSGTGKLQVFGHTKAALRSDKYILFRPGVGIYANSTAGNAIKSNDGIFVRGGVVNAVTSAADARAMTSEGVIDISGGRTTLIASGTSSNGLSDGAALKADTLLCVSGGRLLCQSLTANAIHAKQDMVVKGGEVEAYGAPQPAYGILCANGTLTISDGTVKAIGGLNASPSASSTAFMATTNAAAGDSLSLNSTDGTSILSFIAPRTYDSCSILLAAPSIVAGGPYTITKK